VYFSYLFYFLLIKLSFTSNFKLKAISELQVTFEINGSLNFDLSSFLYFSIKFETAIYQLEILSGLVLAFVVIIQLE